MLASSKSYRRIDVSNDGFSVRSDHHGHGPPVRAQHRGAAGAARGEGDGRLSWAAVIWDVSWAGMGCESCDKLGTARSRLYRSEILQANSRWNALAEIYTMHSFAPLWKRIPKNRSLISKFPLKTAEFFPVFFQNLANFAQNLPNFC